MRLPVLNENEARVLGCLLEKAVTTPDQYPLSLNALNNACNQKSGREPVMALSKGQVERAALDLAEQRLLKEEENFKTGMKKYTQRFCNTGMHTPQFDTAQYAIVTLLLLRGPQTPGELRARSGRLHEFEDNEAVVDSINSLMVDENNRLLIKLPRAPGRKDSEYMHLLSGPIDAGSYEPPEPVKTSNPARAGGPEFAELAERLTALEAEVAMLKASLGE
ncbi:MAG: YceH family protein [Pseudomonadales bacterium]